MHNGANLNIIERTTPTYFVGLMIVAWFNAWSAVPLSKGRCEGNPFE